MKKALKVLGILFVVLIVIPAIVGSIGGAVLDVVAVLYVVAILALPFALIAWFVWRKKKPKTTAKTEAASVPECTPAAPHHAAPVQPSIVQQPTQPEERVTPGVKVTVTTPTRMQHAITESDQEKTENGICKYVAGIGVYMPYLDVLSRDDLVPGAIVTFRQEPENKFDKKAVAVVIGRKRIGFLFRGDYQDMANEWINSGKTVSGRIVGVNRDAYRPQANAVKIDMYFYN